MDDLAPHNAPPQNIPAEQSLLGAMMIDPGVAVRVAATINARNFYRNVHGLIFDAAMSCLDRNDPVDLMTVSDELRRTGKLDDAGGYGYLFELTDAIATTSNIEHTAKIIREASESRDCIDLGGQIAAIGFDETIDSPLERAAALVLDRSAKTGTVDAFSMADVATDVTGQVATAREAFAKYQGRHIPGRTLIGLEALDRMTRGAGNDHMIVIAARPGMGKTSLLFQAGMNIASGVANEKPMPVAAFSLEMGRQELVTRLACSMSGVDGDQVLSGSISDEEQDLLSQALRELSKLPLFIDDSSNITLPRMLAQARKLRAKHGRLGAVLVDYIGLMDTSGGESRRGQVNREQEVAKISRGIKNMARTIGCPVFVAAQLNRNNESRTDKRPQLSDLRESGQLEADANQVWLLYRDEKYNPESDAKGTCEIIIPKNRGGKTGTVKVGYREETTTFFNLGFQAPRPIVSKTIDWKSANERLARASGDDWRTQ